MSKFRIQQRHYKKKVRNFATILNNGMLPKSFINNHFINDHFINNHLSIIDNSHDTNTILKNSLYKDKK